MTANIGIILPAFNEAPRITPVLECVLASGLFDKTVVVDDGSMDNTSEVAQEFSVEVLRHEVNRGKGAALQTGLEALPDADVVTFLDADLTGVTSQHLEDLIRPAVDNPRLGMAIARFIEGRWIVDMQQKWFAILNGQRALTRYFIDRLPDMNWSRFGVEVLMNRFALDADIQIKPVLWSEVSHYTKEEKFGPIRGFGARLNMYKECLWAYAAYEKRVTGHLEKLKRKLAEETPVEHVEEVADGMETVN